MTQKTESETLFEQYCDQLDIDCKRIPCAEWRTPDYGLTLGEVLVTAELKQLDANDKDDALFEEARTQGAVAAWCNTDDRVRRKIQRAGQQLKSRSNGSTPTLAIVYDNGTFGGVDSTDMKTAMYGDEIVVVSHVRSELVHVTPLHPGGNRQMTDTCNTTISAVGLLYGPKSQLSIAVFHNHFATNPIDPDWFRHDRFRHFALALNCYEWTPV